jgi:tripartite ATP-independent transporter DctM subunit
VNIVAEMVLSGISGSATADAAALGSIMIPAMVREGYPPAVAAAINAAAATNGPIIPPSIMMIVYGAYANLSIAVLFMGGMIPGIILGIALMIYVYFWAKKHNLPKSERRATLKECWIAFRKAFLALLATIIIFAGILSGVFTATEAGMVVTLYCLFITAFVYKLLNRNRLKYILQGTLESMTAPLLCVSAAGAFGYIMAYLKVPSYVLQMAGPIATSHYGVLIFFVILFLILGTFMDATPAIIIFMSVVQTLTASAGLNPYHVGVLICCILCFGFITPPYGLTLLLSSGIAKVTTSEVIYESRWTFLLMLIVALILIFFPDVILFFPRLFMPQSVGI